MAKLIIIEHCKQCPYNPMGTNISHNGDARCNKSNKARAISNGIHRDCPLEDIDIKFTNSMS